MKCIGLAVNIYAVYVVALSDCLIYPSRVLYDSRNPSCFVVLIILIKFCAEAFSVNRDY